jgi:hypothetical protein
MMPDPLFYRLLLVGLVWLPGGGDSDIYNVPRKLDR